MSTHNNSLTPFLQLCLHALFISQPLLNGFYYHSVWLAPASQSALWLALSHIYSKNWQFDMRPKYPRFSQKCFLLDPTSLWSWWCSIVAHTWPIWAPVQVQPTFLPWWWQTAQVRAASPPLRTVLSDRTLPSSLHLPPHPQRSSSQRKRVYETMNFILKRAICHSVCVVCICQVELGL